MKHLYLKLTSFALVISLITSCSKDEQLVAENKKLSSTAIETKMAITGASSSRPDFILGINGHPLGTEPYKSTPATTQIKLLKDMGMTWYRIDVHSMSDGRITVPYLFDPLRIAAEAGGVKLLPTLITRTLDYDDSQATAFRKGKECGEEFAARYGKYFSIYNLGNEIELDLILPGKAGKSRESYKREKFIVAAAYLKGMDQGIKAADPGAKTMIDFSWLHYAFLQMLDEYGVKFDIVACHWYSEMEGAARSSMYKIHDITQKISSLFPDKPIWFTEVNKRPKNITDQHQFEIEQDSFIREFIEKCKRNPQVKAVLLYELFDDPNKGGYEGKYGIIKWNSHYGSSLHKIAFTQLAKGN